MKILHVVTVMSIGTAVMTKWAMSMSNETTVQGSESDNNLYSMPKKKHVRKMLAIAHCQRGSWRRHGNYMTVRNIFVLRSHCHSCLESPWLCMARAALCLLVPCRGSRGHSPSSLLLSFLYVAASTTWSRSATDGCRCCRGHRPVSGVPSRGS